MRQQVVRRLTSIRRKGGDKTYAKMKGMKVYIWSGEHEAFWREHGRGYTAEESEAGIWEFGKAFQTTKHCGPEKQIMYVEVLK